MLEFSLTREAERALERSEHLANDGSTEANSDIRALRQALVAVVYELGAIREMLARCYDRDAVAL